MSLPCCPTKPCKWYVATRSFTATCPVGQVGQSVTKKAQGCSEVSFRDAEVKAIAEARALAEAELVCVFQSTQFYTGEDGNNYEGTGESTVSQLEADIAAIADAKANSEL